jgi:hypothetical protein
MDDGVLPTTPAALTEKLGLSKSVIEKNKDAIIAELREKGMKIAECTGRYKNGNRWNSRLYLITDVEKLISYFANSDEKLLEYRLV